MTQENSIAWGAIRKGRADSWKQAIVMAYEAKKVVEHLDRSHEVLFSFEKVEGSLRDARGTRNAHYLQSIGMKPFEAIDHAAPSVTYYDLDVKAIRSFVPSRCKAVYSVK